MQLKRVVWNTFLGLLFWGSEVVAQQNNWRLATGSGGIGIGDIDIYLGNPDTVYAFATPQGPQLLLSTDAGENWDTLARPRGGVLGVSLAAIKADASNSRIVYESYYRLGPQQFADALVDMTTDGGASWVTVSFFSSTPYYSSMVETNPVSHRTIYAGAGNGIIKRSTDSGTTWVDLPFFPTENGPRLLGISERDTNIFFGVSNWGEVYKSTNSGANWFQVGNLPAYPMSLAIDPLADTVLYAAVWDPAQITGGVYKSINGGANWQPMVNGVTDSDKSTNGIAINLKNPDELFIAKQPPTAVYRSTDGALSWSAFDLGLPDGIAGKCLSLDTSSRRLYLGTNSGIYVNDIISSVPLDSTTTTAHFGFELRQNYPNPFNPETFLEVSLAKSGHVALKIYNILGEHVATLVEQRLERGKHAFRWNASTNPSGVYVIRLETESKVETRKAILLR